MQPCNFAEWVVRKIIISKAVTNLTQRVGLQYKSPGKVVFPISRHEVNTYLSVYIFVKCSEFLNILQGRILSPKS